MNVGVEADTARSNSVSNISYSSACKSPALSSLASLLPPYPSLWALKTNWRGVVSSILPSAAESPMVPCFHSRTRGPNTCVALLLHLSACTSRKKSQNMAMSQAMEVSVITLSIMEILVMIPVRLCLELLNDVADRCHFRRSTITSCLTPNAEFWCSF